MDIQKYFKGKGCIVTGAASGIGYAVSEGLLKAGATVFMADRDAETLASSARQLAAFEGQVHSMHVDVTKEEQVRKMVEDAASQHGQLDVLFNNAGVGGTAPIEQATMEHWRRIMDINFWGVVYGIHYALPIMRRQGGGHIVTTSSIAGLMPFPFQALYCASKYAVTGLSESLRFELADEGIHFSVICPSEVASRIWGTPILGERVEVEPPPSALPAEDAAKIILAGVADNQGIIALPDQARQLWRHYWSSPEEMEGFMHDMARKRRVEKPWDVTIKR